MDKLKHYREIIANIVRRHAQYSANQPEIEKLVICDPVSDNYLLMNVGWSNNKRTHAIILHIRIFENKFWIEWDGTEYGVAQELLDAGVPKEDIVLAFYDPKTRVLTDFAIA